VEWEKKDGQYQIHEISCPYYQIGMAHPEVCIVDQTLISKMLALPANKCNVFWMAARIARMSSSLWKKKSSNHL
jgi:predicted ArsR family transcriptional regulator